MPVSIKMYRITQYPTEFPVRSYQVSSGLEVKLKTEVYELGRSEYTRTTLIKLQIEHQIGEKFEGKGFLEDGSIYDLVAISTSEVFPCFVEDKKFLYATGTRRVVSEQALMRLKKYPEGDNRLITEPVSIDLLAFKDHILNSNAAIKGGWFRGLKIDNVEVAYLGGGAVTESWDWERYETSGGTISALRIDIPTLDVEEEYFKVLLTRDGNCVIYKNLGELDLLKIAIPIFEAAREFMDEN